MKRAVAIIGVVRASVENPVPADPVLVPQVEAFPLVPDSHVRRYITGLRLCDLATYGLAAVGAYAIASVGVSRSLRYAPEPAVSAVSTTLPAATPKTQVYREGTGVVCAPMDGVFVTDSFVVCSDHTDTSQGECKAGTDVLATSLTAPQDDWFSDRELLGGRMVARAAQGFPLCSCLC